MIESNNWAGGFSFTVRLTTFSGQVREWVCHGAPTPEQARRRAVTHAVLHGWTPPRWWQWWRRHDQPRRVEGPRHD